MPTLHHFPSMLFHVVNSLLFSSSISSLSFLLRLRFYIFFSSSSSHLLWIEFPFLTLLVIVIATYISLPKRVSILWHENFLRWIFLIFARFQVNVTLLLCAADPQSGWIHFRSYIYIYRMMMQHGCSYQNKASINSHLWSLLLMYHLVYLTSLLLPRWFP